MCQRIISTIFRADLDDLLLNKHKHGFHGGASCAPVAADQGGWRGEGVGRAAISPVGRVRYSDVPDDFKHRQLFKEFEKSENICMVYIRLTGWCRWWRRSLARGCCTRRGTS